MAGYACGPGRGLPGLAELDKLAVADPNQVVDVYHDPAFQRVASFSNVYNSVDLFHFDFRAPDAKTH